jgi:tetratricopeptide (TPR) repeat protein
LLLMSKQKKPEQPTKGTTPDGAATSQPLHVVLPIAPEPPTVEEPLLSLEEPQPQPLLPEAAAVGVTEYSAGALVAVASPAGRRLERLGHWFSPRVMVLTVLGLALLFLIVIFSAWSTSAAGVIFPDWGLASLRIGVVAAPLGIIALLGVALLWQARVRPLPAAGVALGLLLVLVGAGGIGGSASLHRLQGVWFEGRGEYGLALAAYQASGDNVASSQDMARISVEWAEQLSAQHNYQDAVPQLEPVVRFYKGDAALVQRARHDLIQAYLAWGDQARQQGAFPAALAHYHALQQATYCDAPCQQQVHTNTALALLGLAQHLTVKKQYDQAIAAYQQIIQDYADTPQAEAANTALTAPQPLTGRLVYSDNKPAQQFEVLVVGRWSFNTTTHVFTLLGQQYRAETDATGQFVVSSIPVGLTYMLAWIDADGHAGTCSTTNNQPLYTVTMQPLRAADAGNINIECA